MTAIHAPERRVRPADLGLVVFVFAVARVVDGWAMVAAAGRLAPGGGAFARYLAAVTVWDANWYAAIADHGYPRTVPVVEGVAQWNEWPFMPLFPMMVRAVMDVTGLSFGAVSAVLNPSLALVGVVLLFKLLSATSSRFVAVASAALVAAFPSSAAFQIGYAESLAFALLACLLWLLHQHRHVLAAVVALLLVLTRPLALPVAALLLWHLWRDRRAQRTGLAEAGGRRVLLASVPVLLLAWPAVAWIGTGDPWAYPRAITGWTGFRDSPGGWVGLVVSSPSVPKVAVLLALVAAWLGALRSARGVAWGADLRAWSLVYGGFLLVASGTQTSIARYLLLQIVPLWPMVSPRTGRLDTSLRVAALAVVVAMFLVVGVRWVDALVIPQHPGSPQGYP